MKLPISVIVLTYNEEMNIESCLENIRNWASEIFIVDSYSTDKTLEIAERYDIKISQHPFENQAQQFNWALDNLGIKNDWILRLDADEQLTEELKNEITEELGKVTPEISGFLMKRRVYFMGRWIKHGGYYPAWFLRLFRKNKAKSELKTMDEHIILLEGKSKKLKNDFIDDNKKDLTCWINKNNNYASREANETTPTKGELNTNTRSYEKLGNQQVARKRWFKEKVYYRLPFFSRALLYFIYRYFLMLGFIDGREGLIFHFLHGFWYRFLIDAKICEIKKRSQKNGRL